MKETPNTPTKGKGDNSPFRKFEQLAKKLMRVPKDKTERRKNSN